MSRIHLAPETVVEINIRGLETPKTPHACFDLMKQFICISSAINTTKLIQFNPL
jgi:hypothetical protein